LARDCVDENGTGVKHLSNSDIFVVHARSDHLIISLKLKGRP